MSNKFKVGDRVAYKDGLVSGLGEIVGFPPKSEQGCYDWTVKNLSGEAYYFYDGDGYTFPVRHFKEKSLTLDAIVAKPKSPVIEKTVKSIVPGVYSKFMVEPHTDEAVLIGLEGYEECILKGFTASELEAAAQTFMELAAYLRDQKS